MKTPVVAEKLGNPASRQGFIDPTEAANYIAAFTGELSSLAKRSGFDLLGYLLDMARLEAEKQGENENKSQPTRRSSR